MRKHAPEELKTIVCDDCEREFTARKQNAKYCDKCWQKRRLARQREYEKKKRAK